MAVIYKFLTWWFLDEKPDNSSGRVNIFLSYLLGLNVVLLLLFLWLLAEGLFATSQVLLALALIAFGSGGTVVMGRLIHRWWKKPGAPDK